MKHLNFDYLEEGMECGGNNEAGDHTVETDLCHGAESPVLAVYDDPFTRER